MSAQPGERTAPGEPRLRTTAVPLEALARAILGEAHLLEDLIEVMRRQRAAIAADDLKGVDESVFATHRILVTLGEARRQRRALGQLLTDTDDLGLRSLDALPGTPIPDELRDARDTLRAAAIVLAREIEINRTLLRGALASAGDLMHALYAPAEAGGTYRPDPSSAELEAPGGLLLDRQI